MPISENNYLDKVFCQQKTGKFFRSEATYMILLRLLFVDLPVPFNLIVKFGEVQLCGKEVCKVGEELRENVLSHLEEEFK